MSKKTKTPIVTSDNEEIKVGDTLYLVEVFESDPPERSKVKVIAQVGRRLNLRYLDKDKLGSETRFDATNPRGNRLFSKYKSAKQFTEDEEIVIEFNRAKQKLVNLEDLLKDRKQTIEWYEQDLKKRKAAQKLTESQLEKQIEVVRELEAKIQVNPK